MSLRVNISYVNQSYYQGFFIVIKIYFRSRIEHESKEIWILSKNKY